MTEREEQGRTGLDGSGESDREESGEVVCQSTADIELGDRRDRELLYEPRVVEKPGERFEVRVSRDNPDVIPWGFWGGVLVAAVAGFVLLSGAVSGATIRYGFWNVLLVATLVIGGLVMFRLGRRTSLEQFVVCEIEARRGLVSWPTEAGSTPVAVTFEDIRELTFELVEVPVRDSSSKARLEAATLWVGDDRGRRLPIVEASTAKGDTHGIARVLADIFGVSVNYEGTGVGEWADGRPDVSA